MIGALAYWTPLAIGAGIAAMLAHRGLKPLGVALVLVPPALGAVLLAPPLRAVWVARLVLVAQVLLGVFVTAAWIAVKLNPPYAMFEGRRVAVMPTGQLLLATLAAFVLAPAWALLPSNRARIPALPEVAWLAFSAAATGLAAAL